MNKSADKPAYEATVGIVMPCFNLGEYIQEAINSVAEQTFQDFKLIIVDDVSSDPLTIHVLKNLVLPPNVALVYEKKNLGLSGVRNKYMAGFNTKYVFSFDPDDILDPEFLEKSVRYLDTHPKKAAVATWLEKFGIETGTIKISENLARLPEMLITNNYLGSCLLRKQVFEEIGGYDTERVVYGAEDYDFWISVLEKGWGLGVVPEPLFHYRRLATSSSSASALPEKAVAWRRYLVAKHAKIYEENLVDVIAGFEKRASESHEGYLDISRRHDDLLRDYTTLHTHVEKELLPKITLQDRQLRYTPKRILGKIKKTVKRSR